VRTASEEQEFAAFKWPRRTERAEVASNLPPFKHDLARAGVEVATRDAWAQHMIPSVLALVQADIELGDTHICVGDRAGRRGR